MTRTSVKESFLYLHGCRSDLTGLQLNLSSPTFHLYTSFPPQLRQPWHMAQCPKSGLQHSLKGQSLPTASTCSYHSKESAYSLCTAQSPALSNSALFMTVFNTLLPHTSLCLYFSWLSVCFPGCFSSHVLVYEHGQHLMLFLFYLPNMMYFRVKQ